jgi:hypothetical protein
VQENPDIDHAVVLVGYGEEYGKKYWLVRNSWAPTWGEDGYIRIARHDNEEEVCGSDITPQVTQRSRDCGVFRAGTVRECVALCWLYDVNSVLCAVTVRCGSKCARLKELRTSIC